MAPAWNIFAKQTDIGQSRTSALNPVQWCLVILVAGEAMLIWSKAPEWLIVGIGTCTFLTFLLFVFGYIFFMVKDPDALRSESYSLQKLALQKGLVGDNLQGLAPLGARVSQAMVITGTAIPQEQQE